MAVRVDYKMQCEWPVKRAVKFSTWHSDHSPPNTLIVSWNCKHIVHWHKIRQFNAVNLRLAYPVIDIRSPKEVV